MHYYQFNIHEYHSHTRHLSFEEDAVFRRLLDYQYLHETALPNDMDLLAKKCVMVGYENQIEYILKEFFELTENGWVNKRAFQEIEKYQTHQQKSSLGGKLSAARKSKGPSRGLENKFNPPSTNKEQRTINKEQLTNNKEQLTNSVSDILKNSIKPIDDPLVKSFHELFKRAGNINLLNSMANEMVYMRVIAESRAKGYQDTQIKNAWVLAIEGCMGKSPTSLKYYTSVFENKLLECDVGKAPPVSLSPRDKLEQASRYLDVKTSMFYQKNEIELNENTFVIRKTNEVVPIERLVSA